MNDATDNPYRGALLIIAVFATIIGAIMVMAGSPDYGQVFSPTQALGVLLVNVGLLCGIGWIAVSAMLWTRSGNKVPREVTRERTPWVDR